MHEITDTLSEKAGRRCSKRLGGKVAIADILTFPFRDGTQLPHDHV